MADIFVAICLSLSVLSSHAEFIENDGLGELADAFGELFNEMTDCEYKCPQGKRKVFDGALSSQHETFHVQPWIS